MIKKIAGFTVVEYFSLSSWAILVTLGYGILGAIILFAGLIAEHILAFNALAKFSRTGTPYLKLMIISATETLIWIVWLFISRPIVGGAFLFIAMLVQHGVENNVFEGREFFFDVIKEKVLLFTGVEVIAASIWLIYTENQMIGSIPFFVGNGALLFGLFGEHYLQSKTGSPTQV